MLFYKAIIFEKSFFMISFICKEIYQIWIISVYTIRIDLRITFLYILYKKKKLL